MGKSFSDDEVKEILEGNKIARIIFTPYICFVLEDGREIEINPEEIREGEFRFLKLSYNQKNSDEDVD